MPRETVDPALRASHLPGPLQESGGVVLSLLDTLAGGPDALPQPMPMGSAVWSGGSQPALKSIGKQISELLDTIFNPKPGAGLPERLRLTNWDARSGNLQFHNASPGTEISAPKFEASPKEVDQLINGGALGVEQPPVRATSQIQSKIREMLDAEGQSLKDSAYRRGASKNSKR